MAQPSTLPAPDARPYSPPPPKGERPVGDAAPAEPPAPKPAPPPAPPAPAVDYAQPVAYDHSGRPLYAHPPVAAVPSAPAVPEVSDSAVNEKLSSEARQRHEDALGKYPGLNLSEGEYVIAAIPRDPVGLLQIWGVAVFFFLALGGFVVMMMYGQDVSSGTRLAAAVGMAVIGLMAVGGATVFSTIYSGNKLYLTNESVIQERRTSLVARHEQTVSLGNIQNVSYRSGGYLASLFDFGTVQLKTEGDKQDYVFSHVASPKKQAAIINNAIEAFSRGEHND